MKRLLLEVNPENALPQSGSSLVVHPFANDPHIVVTMEARLAILKVFEARHKEVHPFQTNSLGLKEFATLIPLVDTLSKEEIDSFLVPLIDALLKEYTDCVSCEAKLMAYAEMFCAKSTLQAYRYKRLYKLFREESRSVGGKKRDYRAEVEEVIAKYLGKARLENR